MSTKQTIRVYESEGEPYCIREDHERVIEDSQKITWPFETDGLTLEEAADLCREHFPEAEVIED